MDDDADALGNLFTAVSNGDLINLRIILENNFPAQAFKNFSSTLLHQAANNARSEILQHLVEVGANIDGKNAQQMTALHVASRKGDIRSIRILLMYNANVNAVDYDNRSPLYFSVYDGHYECTKRILEEENINISETRNGGWTPLHEASRFGHYECVKLLLGHKEVNVMARTEDAWWTPGHMASSCGQMDCLKLLIHAGIDLNARGGPKHTSTLLHEAAHNGHAAIIELLLDEGADPSLFDGHELPHHLASRYGHADVLNIFLEHFNKNKTLKHLIDAFTNVDPSTNALTYHNAFHIASLYGRKECIKVLLKHNAKHIQNGMQQYPVMLTAYKMHIDCMKVLLDDIKKHNKTDPQFSRILKNEGGLTALHQLCAKTYKTTNKSIACACLILNSGLVDINESDEYWNVTPCLFSAARNGAYGMVQYLLNSGANPHTCPSLKNYILNNPNVRKCSDIITDAMEEPKSLLLICRLKIRQLLIEHTSIENIFGFVIPTYLKKYVYHGHFHGVTECSFLIDPPGDH